MANLRIDEKNGPGLLFILVALVVVAVVGAKIFGLYPGGQPEAPPPVQEEGGVEPEIEKTPPLQPTTASVLIYHTHTMENYSPKEAWAKNRVGDVVEVGKVVKDELEKRGFKVIHETKVHDRPDYAKAYARSAETVKGVLAENPDIKVVLDIHRDGLPPDKPDGYTTAEIDGQKVAKILFVVGDIANPQASRNTAFAEVLRAKLDQMYPGLARGIKVLHAAYNGNLHPNSVLVFVGDYHDNTLDEAKRAAVLFADALADYLRNMQKASMEMNTESEAMLWDQ